MFTKRRKIALGIVAVIALLALSIAMQLSLPKPTGPYAVGRTARHWVDTSRLEVVTDDPDDFREVLVEIWYPAAVATGTPAPYFPNLKQVADMLAASGEVAPIEVFGLRFIRSREYLEAEFAPDESTYPVILLSTGNGTNVEFYAAIADELASHGYVVVGLNHPYDVAAVALSNGQVAQFTDGPFDFEAHQAWIANRIDERTADVLFALNQLQALNAEPDPLLSGRLDLTRIGIMGHSLGGITAAQACLSDARLGACLNVDGLQQGGPFSTSADPSPPQQPFMFMTKEEELPPAITAVFATTPSESYIVVIKGASHDDFTDGPLLLPSLLPLPNRADYILDLNRAYTLAFFDHTLRQQSVSLLEVPIHSEQVDLTLYPSQ